MKRIIFIILVILLVGIADAVYAIEYGGLGISPNASEASKENPLTKAWFIYTLNQGEIRNGKVDIANTSDKAIEARLYSVDAVTTADGAFAPEPEDKEKKGVGVWTSLDVSELSLGPREKKTVDFTINIPNDAEVGDHMGAIIVQSKEVPEEMRGSGMRIATRVGARMYITIPGEMVEKLTFDKFASEKRDNGFDFSSTFSNKGNVRMRLKGIIEITDSSGQAIGVADIPEREVFPKKNITIPVEWHPGENVAGGEFKAKAIVEYGIGRQLVRESTFSIPLSKKPFALASVSSLGVGIGAGIGFVSSVVFAGLFYITRKRSG